MTRLAEARADRRPVAGPSGLFWFSQNEPNNHVVNDLRLAGVHVLTEGCANLDTAGRPMP